MALDEAPPWWWQKPSWQSWALSPLAALWGRAATARMEAAPSHAVPVPVICVGNFVAGGAGKTPTVELLARHLADQRMKPGILSRGHGGAITNATVVNLNHHNAHDVGDEALLHATHTPTVVSADRPRGADLLLEQGCDIIVMDDGFQNPTLHKDYNLVVIDSKRGLGNGFAIPAGPLRVPLKRQLMHADAVLIIGDHEAGYRVVRSVARAGKPVFVAGVKVIDPAAVSGKQVFAFAGIADPSKFFDTLEGLDCVMRDRQGFGDHHYYTDDECEELITRASEQKLKLVTTTKDHARLSGMGKAQNKLAKAVITLPISLVPEDPAMLSRIMRKAIENAANRKTV